MYCAENPGNSLCITASDGGSGLSLRFAPTPGTGSELGSALLIFSGEGDVICENAGLRKAAAAALSPKAVNARRSIAIPHNYLLEK
jgi:hypothetical protein